MGEIATWSAVKTKVGLGKDSNECPTKAELLALSPTGTGESYVGLEISNASSYGNNETVQLSDIHKVTYKYQFTAANTTLNFSALGGKSSQVGIYVTSTKTKYIDGVATNIVQNVGVTDPTWPSWIIKYGPLEASENTSLESRSFIGVYNQDESGKQLSVTLIQAAGVETWEYTFSAQNSSLSFSALGGNPTPIAANVTSTKQKYINGKAVGSPVSVSYDIGDLPDWAYIEEGMGYRTYENKTLSSRSVVNVLTQQESSKKLNITLSQVAGVKTYGNITITPTSEITDIPAAGGTSGIFTYSYSQPWGWNGKTTDGGTITSGATASWSNAVSGSNLGTTAKARTKLGTRTLTLTQNGKTGTATKDVYQAANQIESTTQGAWVVSISANPSTFTEQGGTSQISASARAPRTNHWSSGATNAASDAIGTPTLSIPTASIGFSLSGTTLTVAENTTANQRSVVVRATMDTVYKEVTVTQSAYLVEWRYTLTTSTPTLNFDALGTTKSGTISSYREKYINGSLVEGSHEGVNIQVKSTSAEIQSATAAVAITLKENTTTQARTGTVVYEQVGSGKTVTITCSQAAGTVAIREELVIKESFPTAPNIGGTVKALVRSGYWDVVNGKDTTWHDDTPTVKTKPSFVSSTSVTYELGVGYRISATMPENTSESQLSGSLNLEYGSKTLSLGVKQAAARVSYNYYFGVTTDFPSVAAAGATPKAVIKSRRHKVVNGVEESSYSLVETSVISKPNWTGTLSAKVSNTTGSGADYDVTIPVYENTKASIRRGTVVLQQGGSGKQITLNLNQLAASITYQYTFEITDPSSKVINVPAKPIDPETFAVSSFKTKVVNGTVTSETTRVGVTVDAIDENWLEVSVGSMGEGEVTCLENRTSSIRSVTITLRQEESGNLDQIDINQAAASVSTSYDIYYRRRVNTGSPTSPNIVITDRVTEVELEGTVGSPSFGFVSMELIIEKIQTINGNPQTPVRISSEFVKTNNSVNSVPSGQLTSALASTSEGDINDAIINIYNAVQNLAEYPRTHTVSFYRKDITLDGTVIGQTPDITVTVNPVPYTRVFEFGWKQEGSTITNITLDGDIYGSSAGSRDIISYASLRRDGVEFAKKYIKPTFIPPSEDWLQVIDNGQNSDNSYNWAFKALTNNEGDSARNQQVRFEQPGNGNQALYAYVSQDPMDEGYLGGRVNNNGPRAIRINTVKDEQFLGNINIQAGNFYGLGTLAQDAITIEVNVSVAGTDSSTYTQQVELSNLRFSKSGRPVTISNDPNQNTDYEYSWELYPNANVPASFTVNISRLSSDGDNDDGIRLDIIKKNTAVFPIGSLIGNLTLTPKDPTKLPILLCAVYHRYFT